MKPIDTPQTRCQAGVSRGDITPPPNIYHRMWGAAMHDRATGVHRPLLATLLWLQPLAPLSRVLMGEGPGVRAAHSATESSALTPNPSPGVPGEGSEGAQLIVALDHCILDAADMTNIRAAVGQATALTPEQVQITLSHTHGAGLMLRSRADFPGGDLIGPYLDRVIEQVAELALQARQDVKPASIVYGHGRCSLAAHRDLWDDRSAQYVCGYNPQGMADDTLLVARITRDDGMCCATVVNYACHPTTLAYENTLISPDYVGAMRLVVEYATGAPCVFLQGASGDLGPREGFVGDPSIADRNGRQLGYAVLSALEALPGPGTRFVYAGPVISGAILGPWRHEPVDGQTLEKHKAWAIRSFSFDLAYRPDLPDLEETKRSHQQWQTKENEARAAGDLVRARDCRARVEQMTRQINRLSVLPAGKVFPLRVTLNRLGDALWVFVPGELYQTFQVTLRARFPEHPIVVATLTDDWQPGYLPTASSYGYGIYQEIIAAVAPGSLEALIEAITRELRMMV